MVEHPLRRSTDLSPDPSERWYKRLWRDFVNHLRNTKAPMGLIYLGAAITLFGWWGVQHQQEALVNNQRKADLRATAQALYAQDLQQWASDTAAYELCLDSIDRSDLSRAQWLDVAEGLDSIGAHDFAKRIRNGPVLTSTARQESDCGDDPGDPPMPPDGDHGDQIVVQSQKSVQFTTVPR